MLKIIKNSDMPSTPRKKWMLNKETQLKCSINWNFDVEQSKNTQKRRENKNVKEENRRAICFITVFFSSGIESKQKIPNKGMVIRNEIILINYI